MQGINYICPFYFTDRWPAHYAGSLSGRAAKNRRGWYFYCDHLRPGLDGELSWCMARKLCLSHNSKKTGSSLICCPFLCVCLFSCNLFFYTSHIPGLLPGFMGSPPERSRLRPVGLTWHMVSLVVMIGLIRAWAGLFHFDIENAASDPYSCSLTDIAFGKFDSADKFLCAVPGADGGEGLVIDVEGGWEGFETGYLEVHFVGIGSPGWAVVADEPGGGCCCHGEHGRQ